MVTRLYLPSTLAAPVTPAAYDSSWEEQGVAGVYTVRGMRVQPTNTAFTEFLGSVTSTAAKDLLVMQWVSEPLASGTIGGSGETMKYIVQHRNTNNNTNGYQRVVVKLVSNDGATVRAVLGTAEDLSELGFNSPGYTRTVSVSLASQAVTLGDRVVVESGMKTLGASAGAWDHRVYVGDPTADVDHAYTTNISSTTLRPWVEFSQDLAFIPWVPDYLTRLEEATALTLGWQANYQGTTPTGYEVRIDGGTAVDAGLAYSYQFTGLTAGTTHTLEVRAYTAAGTSGWSLTSGTALVPTNPLDLFEQQISSRMEVWLAEEPTEGTGSLTLGASAGARGASTGSGSLTLGGTSPTSASATGSGSLSLSGGTAVAGHGATGTGSLSLAATGAASGQVSGSGSLTFGAASAASVAGIASASLTLGATATIGVARTGTASLTLSAAFDNLPPVLFRETFDGSTMSGSGWTARASATATLGGGTATSTLTAGQGFYRTLASLGLTSSSTFILELAIDSQGSYTGPMFGLQIGDNADFGAEFAHYSGPLGIDFLGMSSGTYHSGWFSNLHSFTPSFPVRMRVRRAGNLYYVSYSLGSTWSAEVSYDTSARTFTPTRVGYGELTSSTTTVVTEFIVYSDEVPATGSGSLTLGGSSTTSAATAGSGALSLAASGVTSVPVVGSGSLTLGGTGTAAAPSGAGTNDWASATLLNLNDVSSATPNGSLTSETGEPVAGAGKTAWWKIQPASTGLVRIHTNATTGSGADTLMYVFTGSAVNALTQVAVSDDEGTGAFSQIDLLVTGGTTYYIQVDAYDSGVPAMNYVVTTAEIALIHSPRVITGLKAWYSAESITGLSDNTAITGLTDLSGNGNHATLSSTGTNAPKWRSTGGPSNGPRIQFPAATLGDTAAKFLELPNILSGATSAEIFYYNKASGASTESGLHHFAPVAADAVFYPYTDGSIYESFASTSRENGNPAPVGGIQNWHRYNVRSTTPDKHIRFNEQIIGGNLGGNTFSTSVTTPRIGQDFNTGIVRNYLGDMTTVLIFSPALSDSDRADVINWMKVHDSGGTPLTSTAELTLGATGATAQARTATGALSLSATGTAGTNHSATGSLTLGGSGVNGQRTGTGSLTLGGAASMPTPRTGTGSLTLFASHLATYAGLAFGIGESEAGITNVSITRVAGTLTAEADGSAGVTAIKSIDAAAEVETAGVLSYRLSLGGAAEVDTAYALEAVPVLLFTDNGETTIDDFSMVVLTEMQMTLAETVVDRAPVSITVVLSGGRAQTDVVFSIDGTPVLTASTDSEGGLGSTSINVSPALGAAGVHTLTATQVTPAGTITATTTFTVLRDPTTYPTPPVVDASPVSVPAAVAPDLTRHWVLQDLLPVINGGIGSYVFPHNPRSMTSPHHEHFMTARPTTSRDGIAHIFQAATGPKEWTFTGFCPTEEHQAAVMQYRYLNRRFYLIDHHNRAWMVTFTNAEFVPRKRLNYNGVDTDWGSDFTVTAIVLDQNWTTPA